MASGAGITLLSHEDIIPAPLHAYLGRHEGQDKMDEDIAIPHEGWECLRCPCPDMCKGRLTTCTISDFPSTQAGTRGPRYSGGLHEGFSFVMARAAGPKQSHEGGEVWG